MGVARSIKRDRHQRGIVALPRELRMATSLVGIHARRLGHCSGIGNRVGRALAVISTSMPATSETVEKASSLGGTTPRHA